MNKLEELIKKYCPDGVEYIKIGDVVNYEQPTRYIVSNTKYDDSFNTPVLTAGQTFILGYTNETDNIYYASQDKPVIIFDDFTGAFKWVDFPFKVKSSAMKILTADEARTTIRYIFHIMGFLNYTSDEHKRLWISIYSEFEIPLPPLEVQHEIVKILDNYTASVTALQQELEAELTARRKQYEYYRNKLLSFNVHGGGTDSAEWRTLGEVISVLRGKRLTKSQLSQEYSFPVFHGGLEPLGFYSEANREANTTMIINVGASAGTVGFCNTKFWSSDGCYCLSKSDIINDRFLYYYLTTQESFIKSRVRYAGIPTLDSKVIENMQVPIPNLEVQKKIVSVLDNFDAICSDLSIGLPAEIEARQKQYEYYRDALLSFDSSYFVNVER